MSRRDKDELRLELEIKAAHRRTRQTYSPERLLHELGLRCKQKRKFKVTTDSKHKLPVTENLLAQRFQAAEPNQVRVSDITYYTHR